MKLGVLFTGGKDSSYAMFKASKENKINVLITMVSENEDSYMFHASNIDLVEEQAVVLGLPLIKIKTKGKKEKELKDLKRAIKIGVERYKIEGVVTGAVASKYQSERIEKICNELNIKCINPLWGIDPVQLLSELLENKFKVIITKIAASGFDESWLGREITIKAVEELKKLNEKNKLSIIGEGGEYESFVLNCPMFSTEIKVRDAEKIMENKNTGTYKINKIGI